MCNTTALAVLLTLGVNTGPPPVRLFMSRVASSPGTNYPPEPKRTLHLRGPINEPATRRDEANCSFGKSEKRASRSRGSQTTWKAQQELLASHLNQLNMWFLARAVFARSPFGQAYDQKRENNSIGETLRHVSVNFNYKKKKKISDLQILGSVGGGDMNRVIVLF